MLKVKSPNYNQISIFYLFTCFPFYLVKRATHFFTLIFTNECINKVLHRIHLLHFKLTINQLLVLQMNILLLMTILMII